MVDVCQYWCAMMMMMMMTMCVCVCVCVCVCGVGLQGMQRIVAEQLDSYQRVYRCRQLVLREAHA